MKIVLLTWLCVLRAHVAIWVVLGSFIPRLYSGTLISLLFGLNDFAKFHKQPHDKELPSKDESIGLASIVVPPNDPLEQYLLDHEMIFL